MNYVLAYNKIFRNIFYFRVQQSEKLSGSLLRILSVILLPPLDSIEIGIQGKGSVDGGLKIYHTQGCTISVHRAGKNCTVFQGVTIGDAMKGNNGITVPCIGDYVTIYANAVVARTIPGPPRAFIVIPRLKTVFFFSFVNHIIRTVPINSTPKTTMKYNKNLINEKLCTTSN